MSLLEEIDRLLADARRALIAARWSATELRYRGRVEALEEVRRLVAPDSVQT